MLLLAEVSFWVSQIIGMVIAITTGALSSFAVWWFLTRRLRPNIEICPTIATFIRRDAVQRWQVRIRNAGDRPVHDITVTLTMRLPSIITPHVADLADFPEHHVAVLGPDESRRWSLRPENAPAFERYLDKLPKDIAHAYSAKETISLEALFRAVPGSTLRVSVFSTDSYSKTRDYKGRAFSVDDIRVGRFLETACEQAATIDWIPKGPSGDEGGGG